MCSCIANKTNCYNFLMLFLYLSSSADISGKTYEKTFERIKHPIQITLSSIQQDRPQKMVFLSIRCARASPSRTQQGRPFDSNQVLLFHSQAALPELITLIIFWLGVEGRCSPKEAGSTL